MLRRKLLVTMFAVTGMLLALAIATVWSLQGVFSSLDEMQTHAGMVTAAANQLTAEVSRAEAALLLAASGEASDAPAAAASIDVDTMARLADDLTDKHLQHSEASGDACEALHTDIATLRERLAVSSTSPTAAGPTGHIAGLESLMAMRNDIDHILSHEAATAGRDQEALARRFRATVSALTVGFIIVLNVSMVLMLRAAGMILGPIDRLVHASRELAHERFNHRVALRQNDEFDELACAYNQLAQQLEQNEQRKIETLSQTALMLNHELNNSMAIINLQLRLLEKQSHGDAEAEKHLHQIRDSLGRMTQVVGSLKHIRKVVLTDYTDGVKMLDLARSTEDDGMSPTARKTGTDAP